jgi:hypothetical protein
MVVNIKKSLSQYSLTQNLQYALVSSTYLDISVFHLHKNKQKQNKNKTPPRAILKTLPLEAIFPCTSEIIHILPVAVVSANCRENSAVLTRDNTTATIRTGILPVVVPGTSQTCASSN